MAIRKTKGKDYSMKSPERNSSDFYQTSPTMTQHLLDRIGIEKDLSICDPSCGHGAIVRVLEQNEYSNVDYSDINLEENPKDYLKSTMKYDYILTNPPFSLALEFILTSYKNARRGFFLLLPLDYLHGLERYKKQVFSGLKKVGIFIRKPMLSNELRDDGKYDTGMMCYAWYHFSSVKKYESPYFYWIDNSMDVISTGKKKKQIIDCESQIFMEMMESE